jgi:hypothetical protein
MNKGADFMCQLVCEGALLNLKRYVQERINQGFFTTDTGWIGSG